MKTFLTLTLAVIVFLLFDLLLSAFYWYGFNNWTDIHPSFILVLLVSSFISFSSYHYSKKG